MKRVKATSLGQLGCFKQFLLVLAVIGVFFILLLSENERRSVPQPKAVRYWVQFTKDTLSKARNALYFIKDNSSSSSTSLLDTLHNEIGQKRAIKTSTTTPPTALPSGYFNYQWTRQWGKQNQTAWQLVYGDLDCPDNPRRAALTAIIKKWSEIAKQHNIQYALFWGSLLGIVRNNDVIPWDHDMDLLVHYRDILVLEKLGWPRDIHEWDGNTYINAIPSSEHNKSMDDRLRWNCQGKIVPDHVDSCAIQEPLVRLYNRGAFLDVFHFFELGDDKIETTPEGHRAEIRKKDFFPLRPCLFMGVEVWCPNNPMKLLSDWYGPDVITSIKKCKKGRWL